MSTEKEKPTSITPEVSSDEQESTALITSLTPKQQRFVHLQLTGQYTLQKLAQLLEVHPNTLASWMKRKDVKEVIADMQSSTHEMVAIQLKNLTLKAVSKMSDLMESPIDGVALQAAKDILDRSGHKPKQEIKVDKTITTVEEKLKSLINSTIVDADYEVIREE